MSKQHIKTKADPREERERHLHRIELYERRQREAAAAGQPTGAVGSLRALVMAGVGRVVRLFRRDGLAKPAAAAKPGPAQARAQPRRPKPKARRKR